MHCVTGAAGRRKAPPCHVLNLTLWLFLLFWFFYFWRRAETSSVICPLSPPLTGNQCRELAPQQAQHGPHVVSAT